ncbi:MAG: hypothetical protein PQJ46_16445 [Spirochaetales bacterium]|nr:hypothetical protein [Spirochaetales bacterium]
MNEAWVKNRLTKWSEARTSKGLSVQLQNVTDAEEFLNGFDSPYTGHFWEQDYADSFKNILPASVDGLYSVWNIGCGKGEETYSAASMLREKYPAGQIKIYANDADLLNISTAPNLIFAKTNVPAMYDNFIAEGRNGWHFKTEIKDLILFEYHDVLQNNQFPPVDLIIVRDVLSYLAVEEQRKLLEIFKEKIKPGGILVVGANEVISDEGWQSVAEGKIPAYKKI